MLLSRVYQLQHGLGERAVIGFDNLHYQTGAVPKIMFTHDNYVKDYTGHRETKEDFYDKKVILWRATRAMSPSRSTSSGSTA